MLAALRKAVSGPISQICICALIGFLVGLLLNLSSAAPEWAEWLGMPGELYLRMLTLLIVPLVFCSVVSGIGALQGLGVGGGKIFSLTAGLYVFTTVIAASEGLIITFMLAPIWKQGAPPNTTASDEAEEALDPVSDAFANIFRSSFADNLFGIFTGSTGSPNLLGMIVFAGLFGAALSVLRQEGKTDHISPLIDNLLDVTTVLVMSVARFTPPAVGALVLRAVADEPLAKLASGLGSLAVLATGCAFMMAFHVFVVLSSMYYYLARESPWPHLRALLPASVIAFGTASSAVTLPTTIACCERRGYEPSIVRFVLSLGATISMDGTAMYYGPVILWLADSEGEVVSAGQVIVLAVVATLSSMGAAPTPGAGTALFLIIYEVVFPGRPPPQAIAYVAAIDWLMDRFQTATNVNGDAFVTGMVNAVAKRTEAGNALAQAAAERRSSEAPADSAGVRPAQRHPDISPLSLKSLGEVPFSSMNSPALDALGTPDLSHRNSFEAERRSSNLPNSPRSPKSGKSPKERLMTGEMALSDLPDRTSAVVTD